MRFFYPVLLSSLLCCIAAKAQFTNKFVTYSTANSPAFTSNNFKSVGVSKTGKIWAGTQYQGLYQFVEATGKWVKSGQLTNVFINDIKPDANGGIWVGQSGQQGTQSGLTSRLGGVNYFPDSADANMRYFSEDGQGGGLASRNVRSIYVDTTAINAAQSRPKVWVAQGTSTTNSTAIVGGIGIGLNETSHYFTKRKKGLQLFPFVNIYAQGNPFCDAIGGNASEVWVAVRQNFSKSQILKYHPTLGQLSEGSFMGAMDNSNTPALPVTLRVNAIHFDKDGRKWLGLLNGGIIVYDGDTWYTVNNPAIFPAGAQVSPNAIMSDEYGYVYVGTSNGLLVYDGGGDINNPEYWKTFTVSSTDGGLVSNNITGLAYDSKGGRVIIAHDAGVTFWNVRYHLDVTMQWDNSFPTKHAQPHGVAADGVSRIYIKVRNISDTLPPIKEVKLSIHDYKENQATIRGKLKNASYSFVNNKTYTEEANEGTALEVSRTDFNVAAGDSTYWFWYVAPPDFSDDSLGNFANLSKRYDSVKVLITYNNNVKDSLVYRIEIVRPPLLMAHGLASGPSTWFQLKHNGSTLFMNSPRFKYKRLLVLDGKGYFLLNAKLLLAGDLAIDTAKDNLNTLQGNIEQIRNMGYACNQVDYLCHSMGGVVMREAIGMYPNKFYGDGEFKYKNYGKGFTHKIITVNTPHNSSPIADLVDEFLPQAPKAITNLMAGGYYFINSTSQFPWDFFEPHYEDGNIAYFKATPAVNNLQITDKRGGVNLRQTRARYHMVTGNGYPAQSILDPVFSLAGDARGFIQLSNNMISVMLNVPYLPVPVKNFLQSLYGVTTAARCAAFWDWYCENLGWPNYMGESDLIVPLGSESARIPDPGFKKYIRQFNGSDAMHTTILHRLDVGQHIFNILNSKVDSDLFGTVIPTNTDPEPKEPSSFRSVGGKANANRDYPTQLSEPPTFYNKQKIEINSPVANSASFADSMLAIKFTVKDVTDLAYVRIHFQDVDSFNIKQITTQQTYDFKVNAAFTGRNVIWAMAVYRKSDGTYSYYIDTLGIQISNKAVLSGLQVETGMSIKADKPYQPLYQAQYGSRLVNIPQNTKELTAVFEPSGIVSLDANNALVGIKDGIVSAIFTYNGFSDTVIIESTAALTANCINRTIASGNYSNPAIWSKGLIPDVCDSVVISTSHTVLVDTTVTSSSLRISSNATLNLTSAKTLRFGQADDGASMIDNYGSLNISNGAVIVQGRVKLNAGSRFNMTGGLLKIDGNTGIVETALPDGWPLFEATTGMNAFAFTGGTLQVVDPPLGASSQAISSAYDFGAASTLILGDGISETISNNANGFGGSLFPNKIGKLVIDARIRTGNRQFITKKALTVKSSVQVKAGSGIVQEASLRVEQ